MVPLLHNPAAGQHKNPVRPLYGGKTVCYGNGRTALGQLLQGLGHQVFTFIVKGRGRLVQDQDGRVS